MMQNTSNENPFDAIEALPEALVEHLEQLGHPRFRGMQLFSWIHKRGIATPAQMTNLPRELREHLENAKLEWPAQVGQVLQSTDGTRKLEIVLKDGATVETVLIPEGDKLTQCISSQLGCAAGCRFCRSGHAGLKRNLTTGEILAQVQLARAHHKSGERLRNIVFMGIGEPLHNLPRVLNALKILSHPEGLNLSTRRVTISTVGVIRGIERLAAETDGNVALAISLHSADPATRAKLVPGVSATPKEIVEALRRYPLPKRRRFTIEYVMIRGVNDSLQDARELVRLLSRLRVKINLLPLNPHDRTDFEPPTEETVRAFQKVLTDKGMSAFLRRRRGADINAACGQLLGIND